MKFDYDAVGLIIINDQGNIQSFNQAVGNMLGYEESEMIGQDIKNIVPQYYYLPDENKNTEIEFDAIRKNGGLLSVGISINMLNLAGQKFLSLVIYNLEIRNKNNEILKLIKEEAAEASVSKNDFLARMSHEIRTPMNGIIGTASLIDGTELNEKQRNYIHTIKSSGQSLLVILNEILDFSSIEAGKTEVTNNPFDLYYCIDEIYHLFQAPIQEKGLEFNLKYNDLPEYIMGDHGRVRQVIINLLNNAMKFTNSGSITLIADVIDNKNLKFSIHDTGDGIPEDKLDELFHAFSQIDDSSVRKAGGTGLGLSICKSLVELMGGEIGVHSELGKGSVFWFMIPLLVSSEDNLREACKQIAQDEEELTQYKYDASVLLVDDVEVNRFVVTEMLEGYGCSVEHAENGKIALDKAISGGYDIIFMDCQMPVMDGFQATLEIRKTDKAMPIIALTANVLTKEKEKCFASGMNDFIAKPITKECFAPILNKWIPDFVNNDIIDLKFLEQFGDNTGKIIEMTFKDADKLIKNINEAVNENNCEDIGLEAHSLKSVMAQIGAEKVAEIATILERKGKSNDLDGVAELNKNIIHEYGKVKEFLQIA